MPRPKPDEAEQEFVSRYMASEEAQRDHPDEKQRLAIAYSLWRKQKRVSRKFMGRPLSPWSYKLHAASMPGLQALDAPMNKPTLDKGKMSATAIFATSARDRQGDVMEIGGIMTANHEQNPIVLLDHGLVYPIPIGQNRDPDGNYTVRLEPELGEAWQTTYFSQNGDVPAQIYALIDEGVLGANSIGFRDIDIGRIPPDPARNLRAGKHIRRCEMLEDSWVAIPANPECVGAVLGRDKIEGKSLAPCIKTLLQPYAPPKKVWANGADVESDMPVTKKQMTKALKNGATKRKAMSAIDETTGGALRKGMDAPAPVEAVEGDTKDHLENFEEDIEEGKEPLSAETLRDLNADLKFVHDTYSKVHALLEHEGVKNHLAEFLESVAAAHTATREMFSAEHPDLPPLDGEEIGAVDEEAPPEPMDEATDETPADEMADESAEAVEEEVPAEEEIPPVEAEEKGEIPGDENEQDEEEDEFTGKSMSTKSMSNADITMLDDIKSMLEELHCQDTMTKSQKLAMKHAAVTLKGMCEKHKKKPPVEKVGGEVKDEAVPEQKSEEAEGQKHNTNGSTKAIEPELTPEETEYLNARLRALKRREELIFN